MYLRAADNASIVEQKESREAFALKVIDRATGPEHFGYRVTGRGMIGMQTTMHQWAARLLVALVVAGAGLFCLDGDRSRASTQDRVIALTSSTITNDQVLVDTGGQPILAQGGSILRVGETYYWYGRVFDGSLTINCYTSTDLKNWTLRNTVFANSLDRNHKEVPSIGWVGRPDVIYNATSGQYVMTVEYNEGFTRNILGFLTSGTPAGDFTWQPDKEVERPDGTHTMGDKAIFQDSDGQAYLLFVSDDSGTNSNQKIARLTPDYLGIGSIVYNSPGGGHEAMSVVRRGGTYYLFSSQTRGWYSSTTMYKKAASLTGFPKTGGDDGRGWTRVGTTPVSRAANTFNTQHDFILSVTGTAGTTYVYAGDRWNNREPQVGGIGTYGWFPLVFDASTGAPTILGERTWSLDETAGTWGSVPTSMWNPGFEWDIVKNHPTQQLITGWSESSATGTPGSAKATSGNARTGFYKLEHSLASQYAVYNSQQRTGLANGTYTVRAWAKSSGGQRLAYMNVKGHGGPERRANVPATSTWVAISIPNISVTTGQLTIGFFSDAPGGRWIHIDDVDLVRQ